MYSPKNYFTVLLLLAVFPFSAIGQIGIGTITPNPSAILDITSQKQGMLTPRMTTAQKLAIENPTNGLLVFDTNLNSFQYYSTSGSQWIALRSKTRDNFVLVKSQADLPAASGGSITLKTDTYYEINGKIVLNASINLNNAYISGLDAQEDILSYPGGTVFKGNMGGSVRNVTLTGAKAFEITGAGIASNASLLVQNTIINSMTTSVGSISGLGLYFSNIIQFLNNTNGITYSNIGNLLLNNQGWTDNNGGTYEKFTGNFGLVEKASGFTMVNGSAIGFDVSANPTVPNGVMLGTVFSGNGVYVKRYTNGSYPDYNFIKNWTVNCPGIPTEDDAAATGNLYFTGGSVTSLGNSAVKLPVSTTSVRNFRTSSTVSNRLVYEGLKERALNIFGSISFTAQSGMRLIFSIYKNGNLVPGTEVVYNISQTNDRHGLAVVGTVNSIPGDFIEIYVRRDSPDSAGNQFLVTSYNLLVN